jgi:hypothetical protein
MRSILPKSRGIVIVAVLALLLGAFGSSGASQAAALTSKSVKKIAAKVVKKQAPSLSVAHAGTADKATTATTAATATTATNATTAGNATQLGGAPAATYLDRAIHSNSTAVFVLQAGLVTQVQAPVSITVPAGVSYLHITGTATFSGTATDVAFWPALDANCAGSGAGYDHRGRANTSSGLETVAVDFLAPVTAGDHTVRMCGAGTLATTIENRSFTAVTVAGGATG